jgi:hypothetical protein
MTWREDKRLIILGVFTMIFMGLALFVAFTRPDDGTLFQFFSGWAGGFAGGLLTCLLPDKTQPLPGSTRDATSSVHEIIKTPAEPVAEVPKDPSPEA